MGHRKSVDQLTVIDDDGFIECIKYVQDSQKNRHISVENQYFFKIQPLTEPRDCRGFAGGWKNNFLKEI